MPVGPATRATVRPSGATQPPAADWAPAVVVAEAAGAADPPLAVAGVSVVVAASPVAAKAVAAVGASDRA